MTKKPSKYIAPIGLILSGFALLVSTLHGFGGFSTQAFGSYVITDYVSKPQMVFLIFVGLGLVLSGVGYINQVKGQTIQIKNPNFILLLYLAASLVFFATAIFGLTSQLKGTDFWEGTTFERIQSTLFFNNLSLTCFLALGTMQVISSIIFFKPKMLEQHQLSNIARNLTLASGILLIIKTIIDYPLIKESIFIFSYMLKIPFPNTIIGITAPLIYLSAQITSSTILLYTKNPQ